MKKFILYLLIVIISTLPVFSLELDLSVDEEIRKKYNSNKLNEEILPSLPSTSSTPSKGIQKNTNVPISTPLYTQNTTTVVNYKTGAKIPAWTKFQVKSNVKINNWLSKGSSVSFTSTSPVYKKEVTIPAGTIFSGVISDIHNPQASGNGALVEIKINFVKLNGKTIPINGKITKANGKNIFFSNIKGKHQYLSSVNKQIDKGENFYNKSRKLSAKFASNPVGVVLSPVPTVIGWAGYAVCTIASPVTGLAGKGGTVSIPAGSAFEIKLLDNVYLQ